MRNVERDAGANIVLKNRQVFRRSMTGLPGGVGRRATDLNGEAGSQEERNMSQDEIDSMIKPMRVEL
mgnify:CR=1 FL=1